MRSPVTSNAEHTTTRRPEAPTFVAGGIDALAARISTSAAAGRIFRISDDRVDGLYGEQLDNALHAVGREVRSTTFTHGESNKNLQTVSDLWTFLLESEIERNDVILAFGGGVTGDLAGFVAATTLRGIRVIQAPTTVLAMCDAAIGGKTGFNLEGKNLVGAFHLPVSVVAWTPALDTLPERERRSGLAEVAKSAIIEGEDDLAALEADVDLLAAGDPEALAGAIGRAARTKHRIVQQDLHESGLRRLLNLGHTFGHVIETASGYGTVTHGEAVSIGLALAARYTVTLGSGTVAFSERIVSLLRALSLPVHPPGFSARTWEQYLRRDKKKLLDEVRLILPRGAGDIFVQAVKPSILAEWLADGAPILATPAAASA